MINIPQNNTWTQTNESDIFGSLYSSYNVTLDEKGYVKLTPKSVSLFSTADNADFGTVYAIEFFNNKYFILTSGDAFELQSNLLFNRLSTTPTGMGQTSDAKVWQDRMYVTVTANLSYWDGATWTNSLKSLTSGVPHPLEVMSNYADGGLVIGNGNEVLRLDTSHATITTLVLPADQQVECMKYFGNNLYIGTSSIDGNQGKVYVWNGAGTAAQSAFNIQALSVFALEEHKSTIIGVSNEGQLLAFTGGGFEPLANFPVYFSPYRWGTTGSARVSKNGLKSDGDLIYINIQGAVSAKDDYFYLANQPSGLWCYDPAVGLYCKSLSTTDSLSEVSVSSLSSNTLTLPVNKLKTGEPVYVTNVGSITGLTVNTTYFAQVISNTEIKLALTPENAFAGEIITLGGSAGVAKVKIIGYDDYGFKYNTGDAGAVGLVLVDPSSPRIFPEIVRTPVLWGHADDNGGYINSLSVGSNVGGFVTTKVWSPNVTDMFQKVYVKYSGLYLDHEQIKVLSRSVDVYGFPTSPIDGTFSTNSIIGSDSTLLHSVTEGNNLNILYGAESGQSTNITSVVGDEFYLGDTFNVVSSTPVTFSIDNYVLESTITDNDNFKEVPLAKPSTWKQFMVEMRGKNTVVEQLQVINEVRKPNA